MSVHAGLVFDCVFTCLENHLRINLLYMETLQLWILEMINYEFV